MPYGEEGLIYISIIMVVVKFMTDRASTGSRAIEVIAILGSISEL